MDQQQDLTMYAALSPLSSSVTGCRNPRVIHLERPGPPSKWNLTRHRWHRAGSLEARRYYWDGFLAIDRASGPIIRAHAMQSQTVLSRTISRFNGLVKIGVSDISIFFFFPHTKGIGPRGLIKLVLIVVHCRGVRMLPELRCRSIRVRFCLDRRAWRFLIEFRGNCWFRSKKRA